MDTLVKYHHLQLVFDIPCRKCLRLEPSKPTVMGLWPKEVAHGLLQLAQKAWRQHEASWPTGGNPSPKTKREACYLPWFFWKKMGTTLNCLKRDRGAPKRLNVIIFIIFQASTFRGLFVFLLKKKKNGGSGTWWKVFNMSGSFHIPFLTQGVIHFNCLAKFLHGYVFYKPQLRLALFLGVQLSWAK